MHQYHQLPVTVREVECYLPWRAQRRRNGKLGKVPVDGTSLRPIDPFDARAMTSLQKAARLVRPGLADGVGLTVTPDLRITVIDLDGCREIDGTFNHAAQSVLSRFPGTYAEISPSGRGLHLLVPGQVPAGWRRRDGIDIIDLGFVTVTGHCHRPAHGWTDLTDVLAEWHNELIPEQRIQAKPASRQRAAVVDDMALLTRACAARNGRRFSALWEGDLAGYPSRSDGDVVLIMMLLYWLGPDATDEAVDRLFCASARNRGQWQGAYRSRTLSKARQWRHQS